MHHLQKAFENSLRGGTDFTIAGLKSKHKTCKGTLHATGNYNKITTNTNTKVKSSSVSSEGFSESDSVDSLKEEANKKNTAICDRLHNAATKASHAKTAKMRYLEDGGDEDTLWIEDKPVQKKQNGGFVRATPARSSLTMRGSFRKITPPANGVKTTPPVAVNGGNRNNLLRCSGRRSVRKKQQKGGCVGWEEVWFGAVNRKVHCLGGGDDKTNCFKDLEALVKTEVRKTKRVAIVLNF